jgi:diguanylate cyclase
MRDGPVGPVVCPLIGCAAATCSIVLGTDIAQGIIAISCVAAACALVVAQRRSLIDLTMALVGACAIVLLGGTHVLRTPRTNVGGLATTIELFGTLSLLGLAVVMRRRSTERDGAAAEAAVVGLGVWLVNWIGFVVPLRGATDHSAAYIAVHATFLPIAATLLFLIAAAIAESRRRRVALTMALAGFAVAAVGNSVWLSIDTGRLGTSAHTVALGLYSLALWVIAGAVVHPSIRVQPGGAGEPRRDRSLLRLQIMAAALVGPVLALALTAPTDGLDRAVRAGSASALAVCAAWRVVATVRANRRTHDALLAGVRSDALTGLPNRSLLLERIDDSLSASWDDESMPAVYFVDLDRFKTINDSLGHAAGDEVLNLVAHRLVNAAPEHATVSRLGSDEYAILDPQNRSSATALQMAERLLALFREPLTISQGGVGDIFVSASIGVAWASTNVLATATDLLRHADTAMYRAKDAGRNCLAVYDESMHERVAHRLSVETALYRALDRRELRLYHQPMLDLGTGEVIGFEALMRWQRPDGSLVSPAEFIPIAEETGTILPIGAWALLDALTQLRQWMDAGVCGASATMSVNVSPRQLADPGFPAVVSEAINRAGVPPQLVWLEVTEGIMISEPETALATLKRLRSLGVRVALDDFGTGYSSLSLLQKFPLQRIKIDRAFVQGVADNAQDRALVRTIVVMGQSLGLDLVAEGVESIHQLQVLADLGCNKAQGYLISHPVPPDAMRSTVAALERLGQLPGLQLRRSAQGPAIASSASL